jgi:hypothetical protein
MAAAKEFILCETEQLEKRRETNMKDRRVNPNATAIDSAIYSDMFSTSAMREVVGQVSNSVLPGFRRGFGLNSSASRCDPVRTATD